MKGLPKGAHLHICRRTGMTGGRMTLLTLIFLLGCEPYLKGHVLQRNAKERAIILVSMQNLGHPGRHKGVN